MSDKDVLRFLEELDAATPEYEKADAYFRGAPPEVVANPKLSALVGIDSEDFKENYSAIPVKVMANRINLSGFTVPDSEPLTKLLNGVWEESQMTLEFGGFIMDALKYGDAYLEVWIKEDKTADIFPAFTRTSRMIYSDSDMRIKEFFGKLSEVEVETVSGFKKVPKVTLKYPDRVETWYKPGDNDKEWVEYLEEGQTEWEINPFNEVPAFHFRNETPYGVAEHHDAYGAQNQLIKIICNLMGVIDFAGLPERWAIQESTSPQDSATYGMPGGDPANDPNYIGDDVSIGPGGISLLKAKATGTYAVADVTQFTNAKDSALMSMSALTDTPLRFFISPAGQHPAGDSLRAADMPLVRKITNRQDMYGAALAEALRFALVVMGTVDPETPVVRWAPQLMELDKEFLEMTQLKVELGIPKRQAFLEAGYPEEQLDAWGFTEESPNGVTTTPDTDTKTQ